MRVRIREETWEVGRCGEDEMAIPQRGREEELVLLSESFHTVETDLLLFDLNFLIYIYSKNWPIMFWVVFIYQVLVSVKAETIIITTITEHLLCPVHWEFLSIISFNPHNNKNKIYYPLFYR